MKKKHLIKLFSSLTIPVIILIYTISYHLGTRGPIIDPKKTYILVKPIIYLIIILVFYVIYLEIKKNVKLKGIKLEKEDHKITEIIKNKKIILGFISFLYLLVINVLGFLLSTFAMLAIIMWLFGVKNKKIIFILPFVMSIGIFVVFQIILRVPLPMGVFERWRYIFYF